MFNQPMLHRITYWSVVGLVTLGFLWEVWLAPLRPGGSFLVLKILPLLVLLPGLLEKRLRSKQVLSMLILLYVTEGVVRAMTDHGMQARLALIELALATTVFCAIMREFQLRKKQTIK